VKTEAVLWGWGRFCAETTGEVMPINFMAEDEDNILVLGYEVGLDAPPINCLSGRVVRRLACSFSFRREGVTWH
jgi:hypothetical protein